MARPHPSVAALRSAVATSIADVPSGALVVVACSGGPDSLALAAALAFVAERGGRTSRVGTGRAAGDEARGGAAASRADGGASGGGPRTLRAGAVVVDHGLQAGSAEAARRAAEACRGLGLDPVLVTRVEVDGGGGPEAAARAARYAALQEAARTTGAAAVLLGHTLDDQAETVLLGLARGAGARSLGGMPAVRGVLRRPLLGLRRADTLAACAAQHLDPWDDPTNAPDGAPLRSRVRGEVLPTLERVLGPGVAEALARTADQLRLDADALDAAAGTLLTASRGAAAGADRSALDVRAQDRLDVGALAAAHPAVRVRALRQAVLAAGVPGGALRAEHLDALDALVVRWHGQGPVPLPGEVEARRSYGTMELVTRGPGTGPALDETAQRD